MKYAIRKLLLISTLALGVHYSALAQYIGANQDEGVDITVARLLSHALNEQTVTLQGHIIRHEHENHYIFSDGTAQIQVVIDQDLISKHRLDETTHLEITGKVEANEQNRIEIGVNDLRLLTS